MPIRELLGRTMLLLGKIGEKKEIKGKTFYEIWRRNPIKRKFVEIYSPYITERKPEICLSPASMEHCLLCLLQRKRITNFWREKVYKL